MTEFVTLEVSSGKTNWAVALAVKYVSNLLKKLRYLLIAMQYLFCFFPHIDILTNAHTNTVPGGMR